MSIRTLTLSLATGMTISALAYPKISGVTTTKEFGIVKVSYTLSDSPGVVNVDFQTNTAAGAWVSIGAENFTSANGDVNKCVTPGNRAISWRPHRDWAGHQIAVGGFRAVVSVRDVTQPPDWMTVDLTGGAIRYYLTTNALPDGFGAERYKTTHLLLRKMHAADSSFLMGAANWEINRYDNETQHEVTFTNDWYVAVYETTQAQYRNVAGSNPSSTVGDLIPVQNVSIKSLRGLAADGADWPNDGHAVKSGTFFDILRDRTEMEFDLPTEAQWEYSCRGGATTEVNNWQRMTSGDNCACMQEVAWTKNNADGAPHPVGGKRPNDWLLYDMHGNVSEIVLDYYAEYDGDAVEPVGPATGSNRIYRGGSYMFNENNLRAPRRVSLGETQSASNIGFRIYAPAEACAGKGAL